MLVNNSHFVDLSMEEGFHVDGGVKASTVGWWVTGSLIGAAIGVVSIITAPVTLPAMAVSVGVGAAVGFTHMGIVSGIVSSSLAFAGR